MRHGKKFIRKNLLFFSPSMKLVDIFFPTKCFISFSVTYEKYILSYILHLYSTENVSFEIFFPIKMLFHSVSVKHFFLDLFSFFSLFFFFFSKLDTLKFPLKILFTGFFFMGENYYIFFFARRMFFPSHKAFFFFSSTLSLTH